MNALTGYATRGERVTQNFSITGRPVEGYMLEEFWGEIFYLKMSRNVLDKLVTL
jgi:hypothetical protein